MKSQNYNLIIGSHVSLKAKDFFLGSVNEALEYDANTFMVYTGAPQNTKRQPLDVFKISEAHQKLKENNINLNDLIVHAPYIINPCSSKIEVRQLAKEFLIKEIQRSLAMGINKIVLHPGSRLEQDLDVAINQIVDMLNDIFENHPSDVIICLETMAGKGSEVGSNIDEIAKIISKIKSKKNIGVCLDTCHIHESGVEINPQGFDKYLELFEQKIGLDYIKVVHVNDSKNPIGARKDRHENLGYGYISFDALMHIIYHPKLNNIPKILETPYVDDANQKSVPPYKHEIKMIKSKQWFDFKKQI